MSKKMQPIDAAGSEVTIDVATAVLPSGVKQFGILLNFALSDREYPFLIRAEAAQWIGERLMIGAAKAHEMAQAQEAMGINLADAPEAQA